MCDGDVAELNLRGIHIQEHWAEKLYSGLKTVEARKKQFPSYTDGNPLWVIETPDKPKKGKRRVAEITGVIRFQQDPAEYANYVDWRNDFKRHRVATGSAFDWDPRKCRMFAWEIAEVRRLRFPIPIPPVRGILGSKEHRAKVTFEK